MQNTKILVILLLSFILVSCGGMGKCEEPQNPYSAGGHYEGYNWGMSGKSCGGNSNSFIEGCEEYYKQVAEYEKCR